MSDGREDTAAAPPSPRSVTAAMIVISRYLAYASPSFRGYLAESIDHAVAGGVAPDDLALLKTLLASIGEGS